MKITHVLPVALLLVDSAAGLEAFAGALAVALTGFSLTSLAFLAAGALAFGAFALAGASLFGFLLGGAFFVDFSGLAAFLSDLGIFREVDGSKILIATGRRQSAAT